MRQFGKLWQVSGEVCQGREGGKKGCITKQLPTVGNRNQRGGLGASAEYKAQSCLSGGAGIWGIYTPMPICHCLRAAGGGEGGEFLSLPCEGTERTLVARENPQ